jgi:hypothetical protein
MFEPIDIRELNQQIYDDGRADEAWVEDPYQVAVKVAGHFNDALTRTIEMSVPQVEGSSTMTITVTDDGIADDSIRSMRHRIEMVRDESGMWNITRVGRSWRCQPGRGSQGFTTARCL